MYDLLRASLGSEPPRIAYSQLANCILRFCAFCKVSALIIKLGGVPVKFGEKLAVDIVLITLISTASHIMRSYNQNII